MTSWQFKEDEGGVCKSSGQSSGSDILMKEVYTSQVANLPAFFFLNRTVGCRNPA